MFRCRSNPIRNNYVPTQIHIPLYRPIVRKRWLEAALQTDLPPHYVLSRCDLECNESVVCFIFVLDGKLVELFESTARRMGRGLVAKDRSCWKATFLSQGINFSFIARRYRLCGDFCLLLMRLWVGFVYEQRRYQM